MRKLVALVLTLTAFAAQATGYTGQWALDKSRSTGLPPYYEEITGHELTITQDDQELGVAVIVTAAGREPDHFDFRYKLDGSATKTETRVRTPSGPSMVPATLQLAKAENGDFKITIDRELTMRGEPFKARTVETWHLSEDGKVLTIDRVDDSRRGRMESKMVFVKK